MTKKKILITGPVCNVSGYSEHARMITDAFLQDDNFEVYIMDLQWSHSTRSRVYEEKYAECLSRSQMYFRYLTSTNTSVADGFDCSYQIRPPNEFEPMTKYDVGVTAALETISAPHEWIENCNKMKKILVVSNHAKKNLEKAQNPETKEKITTPIEVVPFYNDLSEDRGTFEAYKDLSTDINFLCVSQLAPRKNLFEMIGSFIEEFRDDENVGLILKTYIRNNSTVDYFQTLNTIKGFVDQISKDKKCKIHLIHGNLNKDEMDSLYDDKTVKGYVSTTHGEGFGIPIFNAVCADIPVVATAWSGHMDFLSAPVKNPTSGRVKTKNLFLKVPYLIDKVRDDHLMPGLITKDAKWAYPDKKAFRKNLRALAVSRGYHKKEATLLGKHIRETYTKDKIFAKIIDSANDTKIVSSVDSGDLENKAHHTIQHTTVMMNIGNHIKKMSEK